MQAQLSEQMS